MEAESAGSNPLSGAQLIITTVCLRARPDNDDSTGLVCLSAGPGASDGPLTEETGAAGSVTHYVEHLGEEWKEEDAKMISKQTGLTAGRGSAREQGDDCCVLTPSLVTAPTINCCQYNAVRPCISLSFPHILIIFGGLLK